MFSCPSVPFIFLSFISSFFFLIFLYPF
jgi:hypothetical protein